MGSANHETGRRTGPPARGSETQPGICHLRGTNFLGGPEKQILEHSVMLQKLGWRAVVGSFREKRPQVALLEAARERGLPVFLIDTRSPFSPAAAWQLRHFLRAFRIDILVTHGYKPDLVGSLACLGGLCKQVPFVRGYTAENARVRRYEALDRRVLRRFPRILSVSGGTRRILCGHGLRADRVTVIHNAVDCKAADVVEPAALHLEFGFPIGARILVAAGRLSPEKGHRVLLEAMARLADMDPPVHLLLLGEGVEEATLRRQAQLNGSAARVVFAGFRPQPLPYMAAADVVVNPSFSEGLPNVLLEAFSLGKPVIATDVGGTSELVHHERTGWLVPPGDAAALAARIRSALAEPGAARTVGERARRRASAEFSFAGQTEALLRVYRDLLGLNGERAGPAGAVAGSTAA